MHESSRPRALDTTAVNAYADGRRKNKSSSVRLAILAVVSRVRCAALRDLERQRKPPERGKNAKIQHLPRDSLRPKFIAFNGAVLREKVIRLIVLRGNPNKAVASIAIRFIRPKHSTVSLLRDDCATRARPHNSPLCSDSRGYLI